MKVTRYTGGPLPTNCYMLTDESTGASAVIDPGFVNASLLKAVEEADVQAILLTHGHWDHIAGVAEIQKRPAQNCTSTRRTSCSSRTVP